MNIPRDPVILLGYINTQLRDFYPTLDELCKSLDISQNELIESLKKIDYYYNPNSNQFR